MSQLQTQKVNEADYIKGHEDCKKKILKLIDTMPRMIEKNFLMKELEGE